MSKDKAEKKDKKAKREKSSKHSEDGVKKEKKEKRKERKSLEAAAALHSIETANPGAVAVDADGDVVIDAAAAATVAKQPVAIPKSALVAFANPLADDKGQKKVLKTVKKAARAKALRRGVKEVVKAVRKTPAANPTTPSSALPSGIVVLAADISPVDVISHIPVLCEDHNIPYVFLPSRAELGAAGNTKRPTSVVMVAPKGSGPGKAKADKDKDKDKDGNKDGGGGGNGGGDDEAEWKEAYAELNKLVVKMGQYVRV